MSELRPRENRALKPSSARPAGIARHGRLKKSSALKSVLGVLAATLAVLLVSGASVSAIVVTNLASNVEIVEIEADATEAPLPTIGAYEGGFNILVIGSDQCETEGGCKDRSGVLNDVNMVLHVSEDQTNAVAVSIPRDLVVPVPSCDDPDGSGMISAMSGRPINETLSIGGIPCVVKTVEQLTGLTINFAGLITFNGVIKMGDAVGGIPVCVNGPIHDQYTGLNIESAGTYVMGGQDALNFLRTRHGVGDGSDLTRISSQQVYLSSLVRTLQSAGTLGDPLKVYGLAKAATESMTLSKNFSQLDTLASVAFALKNIPPASLTFVQYPGTTGVGGIYTGKVAPIVAQADALFQHIRDDEPFALAAVGDGRGSEADPNAPVATPDPLATVDPAATAAPLDVLDVKGQTAADYTCSVANN
jgi:LCP family protein required for cell wall assembly